MLAAPRADEYARSVASVVDVTHERKAFRFTAPWRFAAVIAIGLAVLFAFRQQSMTSEALRNQVSRIVGPQTKPDSMQQVPQARVDASNREPPPPSPLTPTAYGIYAVSQEKLYELEMLPGKVPDIRVAVSPAIQTPCLSLLLVGLFLFFVFRW